jgi:hypothetical protein
MGEKEIERTTLRLTAAIYGNRNRLIEEELGITIRFRGENRLVRRSL